jgi:formylglycine-generating enzyme required for sulfatase activity
MKTIHGIAAVAFALAAGATIALWPSAKAPQVVERDGMMWIPAGEFLMGSDHKLAQDNERPASGGGTRDSTKRAPKAWRSRT